MLSKIAIYIRLIYKLLHNFGHQKLDTEQGESNEEEEESTTSSEMSEQDYEPDTTTENEEKSETTQTFQGHNVLNNIMEHEDDSVHMKISHQKKKM